MYNNDYILNLLNIKDKNIYIYKKKLVERKFKGINYQIIEGILTYIPEYCPVCDVINDSHKFIIKWGFKRNCKVKIPNISNKKSLLILHKQRFMELMKKQSEKDIAERTGVSVSKIDRVLNQISSHTVLRHPTLPSSMNWDEFKATKDTKGKMAFMIVNNDSGNIFDIQDSRKSRDLEKYFRRYSRNERNKVKLISTDFYSGYIFLVKKLFKNSDIVIDRFHIVVQAYVALNSTRVSLCKKNNPNYNKLKYFWKLIVKNENDLSEKRFILNILIKKYLKKILLHI